jgi:hypothetical protein
MRNDFTYAWVLAIFGMAVGLGAAKHFVLTFKSWND